MNKESIADQLSFMSTIISHAKVCTEMSQLSDDWNPSAEMIIQAAAVLDKIPHVQGANTDVAAPGVVADCR